MLGRKIRDIFHLLVHRVRVKGGWIDSVNAAVSFGTARL
jgi:hypothetical protein